MPSDIEICNLALIKFGDRQITDFTSTKEGRACAVVYPLMRDLLITRHRWGFAMRRSDISGSVTTAPAFGYDYAYQLPPQCLHVWELFDAYTDSTSSRIWYSEGQLDKTNVVPEDLWEVENGLLLTDREEDIFIRYAVQVTETGKFPMAFVDALAVRMAAELAPKLTKEASRRFDFLEELEKIALPEARRLNAIEGEKQQHRDQQPLDEGNFSWQAR